MRGFHIDWNRKTWNTSNQFLRCKSLNSNSFITTNVLLKSDPGSLGDDREIIIGETLIIHPHETITISRQSHGDSCDVIVLNDGSEIRAKSISIADQVVSFKYCDETDGSLYSKRQSEVFMIRHANGQATVMDEAPSRAPSISKRNDTRTPIQTMSVLSFLFSVIGLWLAPIGGVILTVAGLILGIISLRKFKKNPGRWRGRGFALIAVAIGALIVLIFLAMIVYILLGGGIDIGAPIGF